MASWYEPWWTYDPSAAGPWDALYRGFNLFEAGCWFLFASLVARRWWSYRRSGWELLYAGAFAAFGWTDVLEASSQSAPLVLVKGLILAALIVLRNRAVRTWYAGARLF